MRDVIWLTRRRGERGGVCHNRRAAIGCGSTTSFILVHPEAEDVEATPHATYLWDFARRTGCDGTIRTGGVCPIIIQKNGAGEMN